jgi:hypothetical protein
VSFLGLPSLGGESLPNTISTYSVESPLLLGKDNQVVTYKVANDLSQAELDLLYSYDSL